jgi:hypothetical protein
MRVRRLFSDNVANDVNPFLASVENGVVRTGDNLFRAGQDSVGIRH